MDDISLYRYVSYPRLNKNYIQIQIFLFLLLNTKLSSFCFVFYKAGSSIVKGNEKVSITKTSFRKNYQFSPRMSKTCSEDNLCSARPCSRHIFGCSLIRNIRRHIFVNHFDFRQGVWAELQKLQLIKAKLLYHWWKMWLFLFLTQIVCNLSQLWISHGNLFLGSIGGKMITKGNQPMWNKQQW